MAKERKKEKEGGEMRKKSAPETRADKRAEESASRYYLPVASETVSKLAT